MKAKPAKPSERRPGRKLVQAWIPKEDYAGLTRLAEESRDNTVAAYLRRMIIDHLRERGSHGSK